MFAMLFSPSLSAAWGSGIATGLGLFAVVGAQSAFILRQGLMRAHLFSIILICGVIDAVFIFGSVLGIQALTSMAPWLTQFVLWFGVAFLSWYALQSARRALRQTTAVSYAQTALSSRRAALLGAIGFSLLNPHFWLDMMVVGSLAQSFADARLAFAAGTVMASLIWLIVLGAGSRLLSPLFSNPRAWRILDGMIAVVMAGLAATLALGGL